MMPSTDCSVSRDSGSGPTRPPHDLPKREFPWFVLFTSFFGFGGAGYALGFAVAEESSQQTLAIYKETVEIQKKSLVDHREALDRISVEMAKARTLSKQQDELLRALWKRDYGTPWPGP